MWLQSYNTFLRKVSKVVWKIFSKNFLRVNKFSEENRGCEKSILRKNTRTLNSSATHLDIFRCASRKLYDVRNNGEQNKEVFQELCDTDVDEVDPLYVAFLPFQRPQKREPQGMHEHICCVHYDKPHVISIDGTMGWWVCGQRGHRWRDDSV